MKNGLLKALIIFGVLAYVISPIDFFPGPVDDLIMIVLGVMGNKRVNARKEAIDAETW